MLTLRNTFFFTTLLVSFSALDSHGTPLKERCRYTPLSTSEAPQLSPSCPLGRGLWGELPPKNVESNFWIQCGVYLSPTKIQQVSSLLDKLKKPIWNKKSPSGYHCLIGPYVDYISALNGQQQVRKISAFKNSTLREIESSEFHTPNNQSTHIKRKMETQTYHVIIPFTYHNIKSLYIEKGEQWSRMTYPEALNTCTKRALSLPDELFWQEANSNDIFNKYNLPHMVPYWGNQKQAYYASGIQTESTEQSLLNVLCVGTLD